MADGNSNVEPLLPLVQLNGRDHLQVEGQLTTDVDQLEAAISGQTNFGLLARLCYKTIPVSGSSINSVLYGLRTYATLRHYLRGATKRSPTVENSFKFLNFRPILT